MNTTAMSTTPWADRERLLWFPSPMLPVVGILILAVYTATGWGMFTWGGPILIYLILPMLDWLIGVDSSNPPESAIARLESDRYYRAIVYASSLAR